jgi:hypothetical protein
MTTTSAKNYFARIDKLNKKKYVWGLKKILIFFLSGKRASNEGNGAL